MASTTRRKVSVTQKGRERSSKLTGKHKPRKLVDDVTAILLISPNAKKLCEFYKATLGLPLKVEMHDGFVLHYGCSLGDVHFAIHPADGWPGVPTKNAQSPVISFGTSNLKQLVKRLLAQDVGVTGPTDHGFGMVASFRDPDGNAISIIEYAPEYW